MTYTHRQNCNYLPYFILLLTVACNNTKLQSSDSQETVLLDVWKSPTLDTLTLQLNLEDGTTAISIIENNKPIEILSEFLPKSITPLPKIKRYRMELTGMMNEKNTMI